MVRRFTTPVELPADPASALHAATKAYVDAGDATRQPLDGDLTAIAALNPSDGPVIRRVSGAWAAATLAKADIGLSNVDNTADTAKPISSLTQTALDAKVDESVLTTKGDLFVATGSATLARQPVGADDYVLTVDSTLTNGIKWAPAAASGVDTVTAGNDYIEIAGTGSDVTVGLAETVFTITDSSSVTPDALSGVAKVFVWTCALGNATLNAPSSPAQGQIVRVCIKASGTNRIITLSGFIGSTDYSTVAITITSGKWLTLSFQYLSDIGWQIVGKVVQA